MGETSRPQNFDDRYFVNLWVDGFFIGAASILCFLFYRYVIPGYSTLQVSESAIFLATTLGWVASWPHFSATAYRLYESKQNVSDFFLTAGLVPVLVVLATAACFYYPVSFAPYFLKLFLFWSPYHFSFQTLGIVLIYARRAEIPISLTSRRALAVFFVSSFLVQYSESEMSLRTAFMYAISYPQLNIPAWTTTACSAVMYAALAILAYALVPVFWEKKKIPWIVLLPILTQYLWFVHGAKDISFQLLLPIFHGLQYLLIAWAVNLHSSRRGLWAGSLRWLSLNTALGALLFFGIPHILALRGWDLQFSTLIILAAVSIHHYFVDGVIWKLKRETKKSPIFLNVKWALRGENESH